MMTMILMGNGMVARYMVASEGELEMIRRRYEVGQPHQHNSSTHLHDIIRHPCKRRILILYHKSHNILLGVSLCCTIIIMAAWFLTTM